MVLVIPLQAQIITRQMWVGESFTCDATSAVMGLTSDVSWTTNGGAFSLSGSGFYRNVTVTQYFSGSASVTCSWKYRLYSGDTWKTQTKTWTFTCQSNPVSIFPTSLNMIVGETSYVSYSHYYTNNYTSYANAYFQSSNTLVATVSSSGKVTAVSPGTAYINVYSKISCEVPYCLVRVEEIDPTSVTIPSTLSTYVGESATLKATLYPTNATTTLSWYTSDEKIATVSSSGVVSGVGEGTAIVYSKSSNGLISNNCNVNVAWRKPTAISLTNSLEMVENQTKQLTATITPTNAKTTLSWSSSNESVATVSTSGVVTAVSGGKTTITVSTDNGYSAKCDIKVVPLPKKLSIPSEITLEHKDSKTLAVEVQPADAYLNLLWSSSNTDVASVSTLGKVTALYPGETDIKVVTSNGLEAVCRVQVPVPTYYVVVWFKDNEYVIFPFEEKPVVKYKEGEILIDTTKESLAFNQNDILKVTLDNTSTPSGVESVDTDKLLPSILQHSNKIQFIGFAPNTEVRIYSISGQIIETLIIGDNGSLFLSSMNMKNGIYIIHASNVTYKFIKK